MTIKEVISKIETLIALPEAEDFDNVGLLCGNPEREVTGILVCHDALETVILEAVEKEVNFIVTFHPIIFNALKSLTGKNYVERAVLNAIENKIAIYAVHTAWDNDYYGVNYRICEELGLQNQEILMPKKNSLKQLAVYIPPDHADAVKQAMYEAGAGNIGFYDQCSFTVKGKGSFRPLPGADPYSGEIGKMETAAEELVSVIFESYKKQQIVSAMMSAHPYEEIAYQVFTVENENQYAGLGRFGDLPEPMPEPDFLNFVKDKFGLKFIRHSELTGKTIKRVGVLGGSGAGGISAAMAKRCDAYLTGDLKYHDFFRAEGSILLADIGHFESEQFVTQQLFELLSEKFPKFAVLKSEKNTNPVNYFL